VSFSLNILTTGVHAYVDVVGSGATTTGRADGEGHGT
jgi:hypothetical protein